MREWFNVLERGETSRARHAARRKRQGDCSSAPDGEPFGRLSDPAMERDGARSRQRASTSRLSAFGSRAHRRPASCFSRSRVRRPGSRGLRRRTLMPLRSRSRRGRSVSRSRSSMFAARILTKERFPTREAGGRPLQRVRGRGASHARQFGPRDEPSPRTRPGEPAIRARLRRGLHRRARATVALSDSCWRVSRRKGTRRCLESGACAQPGRPGDRRRDA